MQTILCRERQALEIGTDITVTIVEIAPGIVQLNIEAPGKCVTRLEQVPLPASASELRLVHMEAPPHWPHGGKK